MPQMTTLILMFTLPAVGCTVLTFGAVRLVEDLPPAGAKRRKGRRRRSSR